MFLLERLSERTESCALRSRTQRLLFLSAAFSLHALRSRRSFDPPHSLGNFLRLRHPVSKLAPGVCRAGGMMVSGPARLSELLWPLLVTCCWRLSSAQELPTNGVNGYSLHPPYFNLAEGTKITATATCGEDDTGRSVQDLYCKLVGGPVSGDPSQTIQVSRCEV